MKTGVKCSLELFGRTYFKSEIVFTGVSHNSLITMPAGFAATPHVGHVAC